MASTGKTMPPPPPSISTCRKRPAEPDETLGRSVDHLGREPEHPKKRHQGFAGHSGVFLDEALISHEVICSRQAPGHHRHAEMLTYLDAPRLFAGDCRASALRGREPFNHQSDYLQDHPEVVFTVLKHYNCEQYHAALEDAFERLCLPNLEPDEAARVRPYFSILPQDGPQAKPIEEGLKILSQTLIEDLDTLDAHKAGRPHSEALKQILRVPYVFLYHVRELVRTGSLELPNSIVPTGARGLSGYIEG